MKRSIVLGSLLVIIKVSSAASIVSWSEANQAYSQANLTTLNQLAKANPSDKLINYLNATLNLSKTNPEPALSFVKNQANSYYRNELLHQLLNFYFNNQDWANYKQIYPLLDAKYVTSNESCGYDVATFALNPKAKLVTNPENLIANKMPLWCVTLLASQLKYGSLASSYKQPFLLSLVSNEQIFQFNQVMDSLNNKRLNLNSSQNSSKWANPYQVAYRINSLSAKTPDQAYNELSANSQINPAAKQYLYNLVATDLAQKQMFQLARTAINRASNNYLADDQLEWRVRTFLALNDWPQVIATYRLMPSNLQQKSVWLYWYAYALSKQGKKSEAHAQLLKIPADYNFYSLLAQAELNTPLNIKRQLAAPPLNSINNAAAVTEAFALYQLAKQTNSSILLRLATQSLYYLINQANDNEIVAISQKAFSLGWSEMGISAANRMDLPQANLSFPILYLDQYQKYSKQYNLAVSYPLAVTRQESRFNRNALAFDGGVGLMQIMPATASYIAKKVSSTNCFRDYACNIKFGSWYLSHLMTKFGNNYIYASAGYNAGPGRAHRWQTSFTKLDNRIQIELIPFKITRDYVQKVLTNKFVYDNLLHQGKPAADMLSFLTAINNQETTFIIDDDNNQGDASGSQTSPLP